MAEHDGAYLDPPPGLAVYPLPLGQRLSGSWIKFDFHELNESSWRGEVDPAAGFFGHLLWGKAAAQDTAGTLPDNDAQLGELAGIGPARSASTLEAWLVYRERGALRGWEPVLCCADPGFIDLGWEVRLHHPKLTAAVVAAVEGIEKRKSRAQEGVLSKHLERVRKQMAWNKLPGRVIADQGLQMRVLEHVQGNGSDITRKAVRSALIFLGYAEMIGAEITDIEEERRRREAR
ncbi:hypothetical protein P2H44_19940 [Albimonas sp. CAU 1670]|uniref:hypothetical protein n=1 Tax=Albimonas sp. CAU 1670 TaxID=3032599 RepID=UPI0023DA590B|nr:hypothetical protein [Albimonas sp. CAU 1670]MDF2234838.1 hypothetical protein [Albimonas sp. CAU 1670]